ncbi:serine/threonine-protein kinase [Streptomyces sp. NPDC002851]
MASGENGQDGGGVGRLLAGRYRVQEQLGRGGMGVVWRAVDEVLGREVAVKELRTYTDAAAAELAALRVRMQREARAAARVRHPGVIAVHDVAEVDGRPLIVMELVDGPSLDDVLRERGTLPPREAAAIGAKVMEALGAAHRAGVLHRDVKPGNILLERGGRVVLTDFGIAMVDDPGDGAATNLTRSGELVGSLDYLAPERCQGQDPGPASDVWALGATLYYTVEGCAPFRRSGTWSTLSAIVSEPLPEPQHAGPLTPVLAQLMAKDPQARPDAETAAGLLRAVADGAGGDAETTALRPGGGAAGPVGAAGAAGAAAGVWVPGQLPVGPGSEGRGAAGPGAGGPAGPGGAGTGAFGQQGHSAPTAGPGSAHRVGGVGPLNPGDGGPDRGDTPVVTPMSPEGREPRRGRRVLIAVAAVLAVLAAGGGGYVLLSGDGGKKNEARSNASPSASESASDGSGEKPSGKPEPTEQDSESASPSEDASATPSEDDDKPSGTPSEGSGSDGGTTTGGGTDGGTTSGGSANGSTTGGDSGGSGDSGGGSGATGGGGAPAPVCHSVGGGKYNCEVWRTSSTYTASGERAGTLNAGTNYFYCQQNLGRRETYGEWTNVWWAKTDDDSGNTNVFISDVYIKGGDNDKPLPGLPEC